VLLVVFAGPSIRSQGRPEFRVSRVAPPPKIDGMRDTVNTTSQVEPLLSHAVESIRKKVDNRFLNHQRSRFFYEPDDRTHAHCRGMDLA
jgi:hypothetical protein